MMCWLVLAMALHGAADPSTVDSSSDTPVDSLPAYHTNDSVVDSGANLQRGTRVVLDSQGQYRLPATVIHGERRLPPKSRVDAKLWARPSTLGLPGAVEVLREQPGVAFVGDLSGHFSTTGMPVEGSVVSWEGAQILWPWHFGGLFGALDDWATGAVDWHDPGGAASPARGGGWLETKSRAWADSDQVHAAARLGYVAGGAACWGRRGDWGWQLGGRRTWLDGALKLAKDQGWTDQEMKVLFQDGNAELTWRHDAWKAAVGWFGAQDTMGIRTRPGENGVMAVAWQNLAVPVQVGWKAGSWSVNAVGGWSVYRRVDDEIDGRDTLGLASGAVEIEHWLGGGRSLRWGARMEAWGAEHDRASRWSSRSWNGDSNRNVLESHLGAATVGTTWRGDVWMGVLHSERDAVALQGGLSATGKAGNWKIDLGLERKVAQLSILDQGQRQVDAASPAWVLAPGDAPRTSLMRLAIDRSESDTALGWRTRLGALGWFRISEGLWNWSPVTNRLDYIDTWMTGRADGWSTGLELSGSIGLSRLEFGGRQILSMDVLRDRPVGDYQPPSRWAPWDQRWRTELQASWCWAGTIRSRSGEFRVQSELALKLSSGLVRSKYLAQTPSDVSLDLDTTYLWKGSQIFGKQRTPYFRMDFTPIRMGREGRWSVWWTVVNATNATNLLGWAYNGGDLPNDPISQIPLLPVVFGVQVEI